MRRGVAIALASVAAGVAIAPPAAVRLTGYAPDEQHTAFAFAPPGFRDVPLHAPAFDGDAAAFDMLDVERTGRLAPDATAGASRALLLALSDAWQARAERVPESAIRSALAPWPAWADRVAEACAGGCGVEKAISASRFLRLTPSMMASMDRDGDGAVARDEFLGAPLASPHLLGSDGLGRDAFVRLAEGLRLSVVVGVLAAASAALIGVAYGAAAGASGGFAGAAMMRVVDVLYGLPYVFLVILLISLVGPSTLNLLIAIACVQWLGMARTVRGLTASLLTAPYVEAARVQGAGTARVIAAHVVPNARRPILAWAGLLVPASIKEEAFLSFLGLGVQAPAASLGTLIADGAPRIAEHPWLVAAPAAALFGVVLLVNVVLETVAARPGRERKPRKTASRERAGTASVGDG
ncbi:MAG: ABC transporter permease [Deltaproteobacteria bacterium]|nr:ABC transporter permease [Deltaproteobacteria bacterium]